MKPRHRILVAVLGTALYVLLIAAAWPLITSMPALAIGIHPLGHLWVLTIGAVTVDLVPARYRLGPGEPTLYRRMRVRTFNRMLDAIGWNSLIARWRRFDGTRSTLGALIRGTRYSENAHVLVALAGALAAGVALVTGQIDVAAAIVGFGLIAHVYPIALQRQVRGRALEVDGQGSTGASATRSAGSPVASRDLRRP